MRQVQDSSPVRAMLLRAGRIAFCAALGGLALLIWARLRLVTGVPRTALAEPRTTLIAPTPRASTEPLPVRPPLAAEDQPHGR